MCRRTVHGALPPFFMPTRLGCSRDWFSFPLTTWLLRHFFDACYEKGRSACCVRTQRVLADGYPGLRHSIHTIHTIHRTARGQAKYFITYYEFWNDLDFCVDREVIIRQRVSREFDYLSKWSINVPIHVRKLCDTSPRPTLRLICKKKTGRIIVH